MLEVNILLKEAGLWRTGVDGGPPQAAIMVVPLFETIADLNAAPDIMAAYFGLPEISALVTERGYQEVMIVASASASELHRTIAASSWKHFSRTMRSEEHKSELP